MLVHGLGGDADSPYLRAAALALAQRGRSSLRLSLRGAGASGPDFYHAGLAEDLRDALAAADLAGFSRVVLIGFSLGGHLALQLARRRDRDPRLAAAVAICSPLDLARNAAHLDAPAAWVYRRHVLAGLEHLHARVRRGPKTRFASLRAWDREVVVPRFGFADVEDYWHSQSVGPRLRELAVPALFIAAECDPMIPADSLRPHLARAGDGLDLRWARRAGHVGFPADLDLGLGGERGLMAQVLRWCERV